MKNNIYKYLGASILLMGMVSCDESSWVPNSEEGTGSLEMTSISIEVNKSENVVTRATDVNNFLVTITDVNDKKVGNYVYGTMPEIITLPAGNGYKVTVESHEVKDAEWDNPYYKGS